MDETVLLENGDGTIRIVGERCVVCECDSGEFDFAIRGVAFVALAAGVVVTTIVAFGYAPRMLLFISGTWLVGAIVAIAVSVRNARRYGRFELDASSGELRQLRRGRLFRTIALAEVRAVSTAADRVVRSEDARFDVSPKWVTLHLRSGEVLRLGRGLPWQLPPVLRVLAELGIERR